MDTPNRLSHTNLDTSRNHPTDQKSPHNKHDKLDAKSTCLFGTLAFVSIEIFVFSVFSLVFPTWGFHFGNSNASGTSEGLLVSCANLYWSGRICHWQYELGGWISEDRKPTLLGITTCLWAFSVLIYSIFGMMTLCLCCKPFRRNVCCIVLTLLGCGLSACLFLSAVILWGVASGLSFLRSDNAHLDWGYYLAIAVSIVTSVQTLLLLYIVTDMYPDTLSAAESRYDHHHNDLNSESTDSSRRFSQKESTQLGVRAQKSI